jgi:transposase-like protein
MLAPFLNINIAYNIQKYLCNDCGESFKDRHQCENLQFKNIIQLSATKLILVLRFKLGVSVRGISSTINEIYGIYHSIGNIDKICTIAAKNASEKMKEINNCSQKKADVLMFDETFPKAKDKGCINLGVATCENGLIRMVRTVDTTNKTIELKKFFEILITDWYRPTVFISDYELSYPKAIQSKMPSIEILKDTVHTIRQMSKDCRSAINKVNLNLKQCSKLGKCQKKNLLKLKKQLLSKRLNKIMYRMFKGFRANKCSVGTIYIEGALEELGIFCNKFQSLMPLYNKLSKFINKYIDVWNTSMRLYVNKNIPLTSNIVESKNSIFKAFSKKAKSYSSENIEDFFNAVALMENFDIKSRGKNQGTNAMIRTGIDLKEFGAVNFFQAVGLIQSIDIDIKSSYFRLDLNTIKQLPVSDILYIEHSKICA